MNIANIKESQQINTYDDIIAKLSEYRREYQKLSDQFNNIKISFWDVSTHKTLLRDEKKELKKKLEDLKNKFNTLDEFLSELTSFNASLLIPFVTEYLSKNTFERFLAIIAQSTEYYGRGTTTYDYYVIGNVEDVLTLYVNGYDPDRRMDASIVKGFQHNYIRLLEEDNYSLVNANGLMKGFKNFPELEEAARRIINLRLENPLIGDEECLNRALNGLLNNEATNKNTKPFNKTLINGKQIKDMTLKEIFSSQRR